MFVMLFVFCDGFGDPRDLHVLTHSFPTRRSSDLTLQIGRPLAILVAAGYGLTHREGPANAAPPMPVVTVAAPLVREITEWDDYVGRFEASRSVDRKSTRLNSSH